MKDNGYCPKIRVDNRSDLIKTIARTIADEEVLYLEFGVWNGESIKQWSALLRNSASRLHGFDSFEGLPEEWDDHGGTGHLFERGHFSTGGKPPQISDSRVTFFKGWFDQTLPAYTFVDSPVLVIFLDADIYSSTIYVLKTLKPHIKVGTIVYFDQFWDPLHEQRAFREFVAETGMKFEVMVADYGLKNVAFKRVQ